jgi:hypothetical protein
MVIMVREWKIAFECTAKQMIDRRGKGGGGERRTR